MEEVIIFTSCEFLKSIPLLGIGGIVSTSNIPVPTCTPYTPQQGVHVVRFFHKIFNTCTPLQPNYICFFNN